MKWTLRTRLLLSGLAVGLALPVAAQQAGQDYGPVKPGEALSSIAQEAVAGTGATVRGYAQLVYEANPGAFDRGDINRLRVGAKLRLPALPSAAEAARALERYLRPDQKAQAMNAKAEPLPAPEASAPALEPVQGFAATGAGQQSAAALITGKIASLYPELRSLETQFAGDADYDYALGVAALDAGAPSEALIALERAVTVDPDLLAARMDYARALFEVGDAEAARTQFELLKSLSPPPAASSAIDNYLLAIDRDASRRASSLRGALELISGFDSNANSATDALSYSVFDVEISLDDESRETESSFYGALGDVRYQRATSARTRIETGAILAYRELVNARFVSGYRYAVDAGLDHRRGPFQMGARVSFGQQWVDDEPNNDVASVTASLQFEPNRNWQLGAAARYGQVRYEDKSIGRDADQYLLTLIASRPLKWRGGGVFSIGLLGGQDQDVAPVLDDTDGSVLLDAASRSVVGGGLNLRLNLRPQLQVFARANALNADYDGPFSTLGDSRRDTNLSAQIGAVLANPRWRNWTLSSSLRLIRNQSDIALYEYNRVVAGLSLRKSFQ